MKTKISYMLVTVLALTFGACTDNFVTLNENPYRITNEDLEQDFNHVGAFYPSMLDNLFQDQVAHNLVHEAFVNHLGTPTPFVGNRNNTTYYITWGDSYWNGVYNNIMAPVYQILNFVITDEMREQFMVFEGWAKLIRVIGASRLSAYHGPIIYTNYGKLEGANIYDSE